MARNGPALSPLAEPRFRRLFAAQVTALIGTGLSTVALGLLAYDFVIDDQHWRWPRAS